MKEQLDEFADQDCRSVSVCSDYTFARYTAAIMSSGPNNFALRNASQRDRRRRNSEVVDAKQRDYRRRNLDHFNAKRRQGVVCRPC